MVTFDPDGNEMKPVGELEHICEIGGEFDEASVVLHVSSEHLERERVTKLLGVEPTKAWNPGERHPVGTKGRTRICEHGAWYLSTASDAHPIDEKIKTILGRCTQDMGYWEQLSTDYNIWLSIVGHLSNWNRDLVLPVELLRMLTDRHLDLNVDVSFDGEGE